MTTGALIFAFNNEHIDYVAMADWSAKNIHRHLNMPVCLVTDINPAAGHSFDQVVLVDRPATSGSRHFTDIGATVAWHNTNRTDAYALTPWDQTLVLDADYVVASDQLAVVLASNQDFLCYRWASDATGLQNFNDLNYFGHNCMPMWWATVMMFRRSNQAELIFNAMNMVKENWLHYRQLYNNPTANYRNDHAVSIALNIINGHTLQVPSIPGSLVSITPMHKLTQLSPDSYRVDFLTSDKKSKWIELQQDFHAMGKKQLGAIVANPI
jgi:hypothetical protein|tara:strand:- start:3135 stop:3938 length:804 start_codon:yes stop_codon:yes gene_type:complete